MPRKPAVTELAATGHLGDKGLAVKDGLREVRFNMRRGARQLVQAVEAATHRDDLKARGPFGLLTDPFNLAVRTTASFLSRVDHAAVDVLSSDGPYRSMRVPLRPSVSFFGLSGASTDLGDFITDHHWRYRHWLAMKRIGDVFVHEQAIGQAAAQVAQAWPAPAQGAAGGDYADADTPPLGAVRVVQALMQQPVLTQSVVLLETDHDKLKELSELGAVVVVLAAEVASRLPDVGAGGRYALALRLADEIAVADRRGWQGALHSRTPVEAMARWFAFVLRYV